MDMDIRIEDSHPIIVNKGRNMVKVAVVQDRNYRVNLRMSEKSAKFLNDKLKKELRKKK